jgi:anti-sigma factor RsiW
MAQDREVAGIRCLEVLARLSDYVDDELDPEARRRIDGHLAGCDWCERFGTGFQRALAQLPAALGSAPGKRAQNGRTRLPP